MKYRFDFQANRVRCLALPVSMLIACGGGAGGAGEAMGISEAPQALPGASLADEVPDSFVGTTQAAAPMDAGALEEYAAIGSSGSASTTSSVAVVASAALSDTTGSANALGTGTGAGADAPKTPITIAPSDIVTDANADAPLEKQQWYFECNGVARHADSLASQTLTATPTALFSAMSRIAVTTPTEDSAKRGIVLRTAFNDPITSGAPRCELTFTATAKGFLPDATDFWQANRMWVEDWSLSNDMQIVHQWHDTDFPLGLNPMMALIVQGSKAFLQVRWETSGNPTRSKSTIATKDIWTGPASTFTGRWATFVIQARISPYPAKNPYLKFWIDGKLLASYVGPLGYIQPGKPIYGKVGFYHWLNDNPWDPRYPLRSVYLHRAVTVTDGARNYSESLLNQLVQ